MALEFNNNDLIVNSLTSREDIRTSGRVIFGSGSELSPSLLNTFILGDNIIPSVSGYTYVNNLSATGNLVARNLNNIAISLGAGDQESNLAVGVSALNNNTLGAGNIGVGRNALAKTTGGVLSVTITNSGIGYATPPTVIIAGGGFEPLSNPEVNAVGIAILSGNIVPTFSAVSNNFAVSALSGNPNYSSTFQAITTFNGIIRRVDIINPGLGYFSTPTITFDGGLINTQIFDRDLNGNPFTTTTGAGSAVLNFPSNNIAVGFNAGSTITLGDNNILIGTNAGREVQIGSRNTVLGSNNVLWNNSEDNIVIGYNNSVSGFKNVIVFGNNLSADKSNYAFMSALDVKILDVESGNIGRFLNVDNVGISATNLFVTNVTAAYIKTINFDGQVDLTQLSTPAINGQTVVYTDGIWGPGFSLAGFAGTRLHDFQLTSFDSGMNVVTADTSYCGVAPSGYNTGDSAWRVVRLKFNDAGLVYEQGIAFNIPWTSRYSTTYTLY